jgi:hypothetical protein
MRTIDQLITEAEADEIVYSAKGVWYAAYNTEFTVLTNVSGARVSRYDYVDAADLESAMRKIRRYEVLQPVLQPVAQPPSRKPDKGGHGIIDDFFKAEAEGSWHD